MNAKLLTILALTGLGLGSGALGALARHQQPDSLWQQLTWHAPINWVAQTTDFTAEVVPQQTTGTSQNQRCSYSIQYPQVKLAGNPALESQINRYLKAQFFQSQVEYLQPFDLESCASKIGQQTGIRSFSEVVKYSVELNRKGILSLRYFASSVQKQQEPAQDSFLFYTPTRALTLNLTNGKAYTYPDLFRPGTNPNRLIEERVRQQYGVTPGEGRGSAPTTYSFYLDERGLVIFNLFPQRSLAAAHLVIHPSEIADLVNPQGPLQQFLP